METVWTESLDAPDAPEPRRLLGNDTDVDQKALRDHKLLRGRKLGIDASVMEANASMRSLEHRLTGEDYPKYVSGLAEEAGVDPSDPGAVRNFDRKRKGRKTSNDTWQTPHDPDAKIGRTKQGTTRMIYKPEHVVDLETGAIVDADVRPGDEHDTADLTEKVLEVEARLNDVMDEDKNTERVELVARSSEAGRTSGNGT